MRGGSTIGTWQRKEGVETGSGQSGTLSPEEPASWSSKRLNFSGQVCLIIRGSAFATSDKQFSRKTLTLKKFNIPGLVPLRHGNR